MGLVVDGTTIATTANVYVDGTPVNNVYIDDTLVWTKASSSTPTWHTVSTTPIELRTYDADGFAIYTDLALITLSETISLAQNPTKIRITGYYETGYNFDYSDWIATFDYFNINGTELSSGSSITGSTFEGITSRLYWQKSGNNLYIKADVFSAYPDNVAGVLYYENFIITKVEAYY